VTGLVVAMTAAFVLALGLRVYLAWRSTPRRRHLRATRRNTSMLTRPGRVGTGYSRRW
jgi:hypothetical protein